jgi:hypothetical protein
MAKDPQPKDTEHFRELGLKSAAKRKRPKSDFSKMGRKSAEKRRQRPGFNREMARLSSLAKVRARSKTPCRHCGGPKSRKNTTGFCRTCQRTYGLRTLRKWFPDAGSEA